MSDERFSRTERLLGEEAMTCLAEARVAVFGLGGVGGYVVEALARSGVGALDLVDHVTVRLSNLNRQIIALESTVGQEKVRAWEDRIRQIAPSCRVTTHPVFFLPEEKERFDFRLYDYVVDAIDTVAGKMGLIEQARAAGTPVISALGAGNKLDPTRFRVADIYETSVCPLAKVIRKECRKRGIDKLKVVYSDEEPRKPYPTANADEKSPGHPAPGSVAFVPSVCGLIIAGAVIQDLIHKKS
ncbi:MAG: tRNA threonylcarbamoyladenosine dehydratase [Firmicutes bacterium]|nr:tRNA threonylcarbamoyladenosine dehydratase [Bacillota bacterium]